MPSTSLSIDICKKYIEEYLFGSPGQACTLPGETPGRIGVELECFPYTIDSQKNISPAKLYGKEDDLLNTLVQFAKKKGGKSRYSDHNFELQKEVVPGIDFPDGSSFQFEPGAQVEISTAPCNSIQSVFEKINSLQEILHQVTSQSDFHFLQSGTNPWFSVAAIGMQLNKNRYKAMAGYFDSLNHYGRQMMCQTCSLQVNVDAGDDWDTRTRRFVAANLLAPFATAIFANSPVIGGNVNGHKSYRSFIWQHLDKARTGVFDIDHLSGSLDKKSVINAYLKFALKAPIIYIEEFGQKIFDPDITLEYWMSHPLNGILPSLSHFKNHLSLLFPEVRLKGYLELRSVDAPPPEWQMTPVVFYCGLLYSNHHLDKTLDLLLPYTSQLPSLMEKATAGLEADEIFNVAKKLMRFAIEGVASLPDTFGDKRSLNQVILFSERFTMQRKTFADEYLQNFVNKKNIIAR